MLPLYSLVKCLSFCGAISQSALSWSHFTEAPGALVTLHILLRWLDKKNVLVSKDGRMLVTFPRLHVPAKKLTLRWWGIRYLYFLLCAVPDLIDCAEGSRAQHSEFLQLCLLENTHLSLVRHRSAWGQWLHQLQGKLRCHKTTELNVK